MLVAVGLVATLILLSIAAYALRRARLDPVARALALLTAVLATWNLGATLFQATGEATWQRLDVTFSPLTAPLVLELVLAYVGLALRHRRVRLVAWVGFGALAMASATAWFGGWGREFVAGATWSVLYLAGWLPIFVFCLFLLARETRRLRDTPLLALRARLLLVALFMAGLLGQTELWNDLFQVPGLGALGVALAALLMAAVVFRFGIITAHERVASAVYLGLVVLVTGVVLAAVATASRGDAVATVLVAIFLMGLLVLVARELALSMALARARTIELATLGRFTAQMSHDLKNPLAAMKGAVQYLQGATSPEPTMLELIAAQVGRFEAILERYGRLATTTIEAHPLDIHALATDVAKARLVGSDVVFEATDERPEPCSFEGDRDLLASAFENIVTNALQAMASSPRRLTVHTTNAGDGVQVTFADTGPGIEPRFLERVTDDFFTTRVDGSGLGLAFVRRIAAAHGGRIAIASALGQGTRVTLELPCPIPRSSP